jgi:hypothetical protein
MYVMFELCLNYTNAFLQVFTTSVDPGTLVFDVIQTATPLLERIEALLTASPSDSLDHLKDLKSLLVPYLRAFKLWSDSNQDRLIALTKESLRALYQAQSALPSDCPDFISLSAKFSFHINRMREKLWKLDPQALGHFDLTVLVPMTVSDLRLE